MPSLSDALRQEIERLLGPLASAAGSADRWALVLALVGHGEDTVRDAGLRTALDRLGALADLAESDLESWDGIEALLRSSATAMEALHDLGQAGGDPALRARLAQLGPDLADQLTAIYLRRYHPHLFRTGAVLTLIDPGRPQPPVLTGNTRTRTAWTRDELHPERLGPLLGDPWTMLAAGYLPNRMARAADAHAAADRLFPLLTALAGSLGLPAALSTRSLKPEPATGPEFEGDHFDSPEPDPETAPEPPPPADPALYFGSTQPQFVLRIPDGGPAGASAGVALTASSLEHPGAVAGLILELTGALNWTRTHEPWTLTASSQGTVPAVVIGPDGLTTATAATTATARLAAARDGVFVLGATDGTRIELEKLRAAMELAVGPSTAAALSVAAESGRLVIAPSDGDSFLQFVLPSNGVSVTFAAGMSLSSRNGFELSGGVGLEATQPVHVSLGPVGRIDDVRLAITGGQAEIVAGVTVHLGPVDVSIGGLGVRATVAAEPGNLGVADLDLGFKAPDRLGLSIEAGPLSGGGFLAVDPENGGYAGEVQLQFEKIAVRAVGVLTTALPDGRPGFSLLVLVSAEFPPVQLGLGFMLVGVGGLLGINRTVSVDALRSGLKTGALDAVLTPPDPTASPGRLVASLAGLFPPAEGRHVFAPTARIVWGSPVLITIDLALVLELPSPVRLVALGRMRAILPDEREAIVRLQVDVLGVIDFDRSEAAVDATLVDSRLAQFALTGDLALRLSWGANPSFLLAVGGFHPRFSAPPGFPALQRVAIALAQGDNPKLRLEAYLALTSNTVQFGSRVDLAARAGSFSLVGFLSFDALVTLAPLAFAVDIAAKLAVKVGSRTLLAISLALSLSGPRPWHARGRASFSILFFDISFGFDVTIGDPAQPALPAPVDVAPLMLAALNDPRAWTAQPLTGGARAVTLRALEPGSSVIADPLSTLQVRQRVAPLDLVLDRFGAAVPSGARRFRISAASIGGVRVTPTPVRDRFAPAQFTNLSDDAKLSAPSFVEMTSGATLGADGYATGAVVNISLTYEQLLVPAAGVTGPAAQRLPLPGDVLRTLTATAPSRTPVFGLRDAS
jgi:hypothetical protein